MEKKDTDFNKDLKVRIPDTEVTERLARTFAESKYKKKNAFLNELIASGLDAYVAERERYAEFKAATERLDKRLFAIEEEQAEFQAMVYKQFKDLQTDALMKERALGAMYNLLTALSEGYFLPQKEIESGKYDFLPVRFWSAA